MVHATITKPATLPAAPVARYLFGLASNAAYGRAARDGELVDGLPVFRAGSHRWLVATATVERVIGRPLDDNDLATLDQLEQDFAAKRRELRRPGAP